MQGRLSSVPRSSVRLDVLACRAILKKCAAKGSFGAGYLAAGGHNRELPVLKRSPRSGRSRPAVNLRRRFSWGSPRRESQATRISNVRRTEGPNEIHPSPEDFIQFHSDIVETCEYDAMYGDVAHSHFSGDVNFEFDDIVDLYSERGSDVSYSGSHDSGGGHGHSAD
jgi:hypothetical protein